MSTKTTGKEFKSFYKDDSFWPQDKGNTYHEDDIVEVDGASWEEDYDKIPDDAKVTVEGGVVMGPQWDGNEPSFEGYFKKWRKAQSTTFLTIVVPKEKLDEVKAAIKSAGGKVA